MKWDVEPEQQPDTWERVVTLSTAVRRKVALVFPLNLAVILSSFPLCQFFFFFFAGIILWACFHLWYGWRIFFFFFIGNWVVRAGICNFQILSGIQFFRQLEGIKESQWVVSCVSLFFSYFQHGKRKTKTICHGLGSLKFWASEFGVFCPHSQACWDLVCPTGVASAVAVTGPSHFKRQNNLVPIILIFDFPSLSRHVSIFLCFGTIDFGKHFVAFTIQSLWLSVCLSLSPVGLFQLLYSPFHTLSKLQRTKTKSLLQNSENSKAFVEWTVS